MGKVIIGIHGRSNKPRPEALKAGWNQAILEGLSQNVGLPAVNFQFDLAYYSDVHYDNPLPESDYPYDAAGPGTLKRYRATLLDRIRSRAGDWLDDPFDWLEERSGLFSRVARSISRRFLRDLGDYYGDESDRRETQRQFYMGGNWQITDPQGDHDLVPAAVENPWVGARLSDAGRCRSVLHADVRYRESPG